jgi:hypothetical protein
MTGSMTAPSSEASLNLATERRVVIVTFESGQILDVTGPMEVFSHASRFLPGSLPHPCRDERWWPRCRQLRTAVHVFTDQ